MANFQFSARRLILACGFAVAAAAAPVAAAFATPASVGPVPSIASCPSGETEDMFTGICVPDVVPNSPEIQPAHGPLPEVSGVPCTGANTGQCIGLSEEQQGPVVTPHSSVSSSP